ncbi:MAG: recombination regulator RecX [Gammaproteobacteria bacterium]|nr:recombination regulator RecX [Gammaproteobacteria bacterium]MBU1656118.1 recombination regulator RecX [Gammaproteobacteria bacterium]MBU1960512.1 recombination regulator RecX [Gammaproteobacteria bacterium]
MLAVREHSRAELERKLAGKYAAEALGQVLDDLAGRGLLSDARFAEQYAAQRADRGYGPVRIRSELRERGVAPDQAELALESLEQDWFEAMRAAHDRKFGPGPCADRKEQARHARFLEYRGFPGEMIRTLLFDP